MAQQLNLEPWMFMERATPFVVVWIGLFTLVTLWRLSWRLRAGIDRVPDSPVLTELAGLPLTLLPSIGFVWAVANGDWLSSVLLLWWGPGFLLSLAAVGIAKKSGTAIDWFPHRIWISWACKISYVIYAALFIHLGMHGMLFAFSAWILNDQFEKAFMSLDADRLRRTFDDFWLIRLAYPAGLLIPLLAEALPFRHYYAAYGSVLFCLWLAGVFYVHRSGRLKERPADTSLLRNMAYFRRRDS